MTQTCADPVDDVWLHLRHDPRLRLLLEEQLTDGAPSDATSERG